MSDEPTERDVEDMLALRFPKWKQWERDEFANRIEGILAERIAQARSEAWDEGARAAQEWETRDLDGPSGDPPRNPYQADA